MVLNVDLEARPRLVWLGSDGLPVTNGSNITVGTSETVGDKTSLALNFTSLASTDRRDFTCEVSVLVPYMNVTLSKVVGKSLIVTCKF